MALSVGKAKRCLLTECICENRQMPLYEIVHGEEHPRLINSKVSPQLDRPYLLVDHLDMITLKKLSRRWPKMYRYVKARKAVEVA